MLNGTWLPEANRPASPAFFIHERQLYMTEFTETLRHYCRNPRCRSKLPTAVRVRMARSAIASSESGWVLRVAATLPVRLMQEQNLAGRRS
jgi:hypothetical protein